ncbi:acyl carrier protein [Catelliglobosispora koreensis]|uniref:acyl carrier protein n=1 Tax=Catelliglobosispora koreensis TaxID=129052 RepID=UPI00035C625C|nr:acyl carrier protein [Catelliglobosispora koreensis]
MNTSEAIVLVRRCVHEVAPDIDMESISDDAHLQETLHLDSLDFLQVVELLSSRSGIRIDEEDYPRLATIASAAAFLAQH